ncbi:hypothetical protein EV361DRAFT_550381 [Lentinula raphanica]|nr:hypothetical protein EV361DRAFT_550381 [Lentinula raphanica]
MPIIFEIRSLQNRSSFLTAGRSNITLNISDSHSYCSIRTNKKRTALCTMRLLLTRATTLYLSLLLPTYILATPISLPAGQPASVQDISHTPTIHARQPDPLNISITRSKPHFGLHTRIPQMTTFRRRSQANFVMLWRFSYHGCCDYAFSLTFLSLIGICLKP